MANQEGAARSAHYIVIAQAPDVCKSPATPVPYTIVAFLSDATGTSESVRIRKDPVFHMKSRVVQVIGDEAGVGGGVKSGVNKGYCRPLLASTTVRANKQFVCRHEHTTYEMNCAGPEGPGNTIGKLVYLGAMVPAALGPDGGALDSSKSIASQGLLDTLGLTPEKFIALTNQALAMTQMDWDDPGAVLGAIGGVASSVGFGDLGGALSTAGKGVDLSKADWSDPATALAALGVASSALGLANTALGNGCVSGVGTTLGNLAKLGKQGLTLARTDWSSPLSIAKGLGAAVKIGGAFSSPQKGTATGSPIVPQLAGADGQPDLARAREGLANLQPVGVPRHITAADLSYLERENPPAFAHYQGLSPEQRERVLFEVEYAEDGSSRGDTARIYVPGRGYSSSMEEQNSALHLPAALESAFVSSGAPGSFYEVTGLTSPPTHPGNVMLFGGLIDLGSPEMPGAGTGFLWFVPDRILGADMSPYFDYHDLNYYGSNVTLADVGQIMDVEWGAFLTGLSASGAGPLTMALQVVYSAATSTVGMMTALWNSAKGMVGTISSLPSTLSMAELGDVVSGAFDSLTGGVASATSPSGALSACFGTQAQPVDPLLAKPVAASPAGTDGILVSLGVSTAAAAAALAAMEIQVGADSSAPAAQGPDGGGSGPGGGESGDADMAAGTSPDSEMDSGPDGDESGPGNPESGDHGGVDESGVQGADGSLEKGVGTTMAKDQQKSRAEDLAANEANLRYKAGLEQKSVEKLELELAAVRADPNVAPEVRAGVEARYAMEKRRLDQTLDQLHGVSDGRHIANQFQDVGKGVGVLFAVDGLVEAEKRRDALIAEGRYEDAYRESLGGAAKFVVDSGMALFDPTRGATSIAAGVMASSAAEAVGHAVADATFDTAVDVSHWLYQQPWWPKNRVPSVPRH